jgi:hypothetical protein
VKFPATIAVTVQHCNNRARIVQARKFGIHDDCGRIVYRIDEPLVDVCAVYPHRPSGFDWERCEIRVTGVVHGAPA